MSSEHGRAEPGRAAQVAGGIVTGLGGFLLALVVLGTETGPGDGWWLPFLLVVAVGCGGLAVARSPRWRAFGVTLAVMSVVPYVVLFLILAWVGTQIGS